jgi:hypothetical protein
MQAVGRRPDKRSDDRKTVRAMRPSPRVPSRRRSVKKELGWNKVQRSKHRMCQRDRYRNDRKSHLKRSLAKKMSGTQADA